MGRLVYVKVVASDKGAHQYVQIDGVRIGDIWRKQVKIKDAKGNQEQKWRWFARLVGARVIPGEDESSTSDQGFGSKDKAVDALITAGVPAEH